MMTNQRLNEILAGGAVQPAGLSTHAGATVCALLPTGLLTGALWQHTGPGPAAALAMGFLALASTLLLGVRKLSAVQVEADYRSTTQKSNRRATEY
jgi:hypothetical protein